MFTNSYLITLKSKESAFVNFWYQIRLFFVIFFLVFFLFFRVLLYDFLNGEPNIENH